MFFVEDSNLANLYNWNTISKNCLNIDTQMTGCSHLETPADKISIFFNISVWNKIIDILIYNV
jgi:hypothetical protein